MRDNRELHLARIAGLCETKFGEWGHQSAIIKRFRGLLWEGAVMRVLRRAALEVDEKEQTKRINAGMEHSSILGPLRPSRMEAMGTPASLVTKYLNTSDADRVRGAFVNKGSQAQHVADDKDTTPLILRIMGTRRHVSTDGLLEYRVEVSPTVLVTLALSGIKGIRPEPSITTPVADTDDYLDEQPSSAKKSKKPPPHPHSTMPMWIPASMMHQVHPDLVEDYAAIEGTKKKRTGKGTSKATVTSDDGYTADSHPEASTSSNLPPKQPKRTLTKRKTRAVTAIPENSSDVPQPALGHEGTAADATRTNNVKRGFLFTMRDPDDPSFVDVEESEDEMPAQLEHDRSDWIKASSSSRYILDSEDLGTGRLHKRRKTNVTDGDGNSMPISAFPADTIRRQSWHDFEGEKHPVMRDNCATFHSCHPPPSSQESNPFLSDAEVIIDLT